MQLSYNIRKISLFFAKFLQNLNPIFCNIVIHQQLLVLWQDFLLDLI